MAKNKDISNFSMLDLFRTEVSEQGKILTEELLALEDNPAAMDRLEVLMRATHSIKGAARLVGVEPVVRLAHVAEDVFVAAQNSTVMLNSSHVDILLSAVDGIISISRLSESEIAGWDSLHEGELDELIKNIAAIKSGESSPLTSSRNIPIPEKRTRTKKEKKPDGSKESGDKKIKLKEKTSLPAEKDGQEKIAAKSVPARSGEIVEAKSDAVLQEVVVADDLDDRVLRVTAERWNYLMGLAGEVKVESGWLHHYLVSLANLKRRQVELVEILDSMRSGLDELSVPKSIIQMMQTAQKKISECRTLLADQTSDLDGYERRISTLTNRLHRETIRTRMRPFSDGVEGFQRMVRDIAKSLGKKVKLEINGLSIQVDRDVLGKMEAPMNHILRNAIDHGIESPDERIKAGKPEQASIRIAAVHIDGMLSIMMDDDGRGIDVDKLRLRIIERKLVTRDMADKLSEKELLEFIFLPSFSTRDVITDLSGRGVGLDVVLSTIQRLHGTIETLTKLGVGTRFHMRLPLTMSVMPCLIAIISGEPYAFPLARITRAVKLASGEISVLEDHQFAKIDGENIGLVGASQVLGLGTQVATGNELSIIIIGDKNNRCGVVVDKLVGQRELAVQSLDQRLGKIPDVSAAAVLEDGSPVLILDIDDLVLSVDALIRKGGVSKVVGPDEEKFTGAIKNILVVDDSLTVREVERYLLENAGYHVDVAVDGIDGWNAIRAFKKYDLVVTDIDMPRMDGIELVRLIKSDRTYNSLPVIIVSYKEREEDRRRGMEAGADYYLTKGSFHDSSLLDAVSDLIGEVES